jgi:hypothetical protein
MLEKMSKEPENSGLKPDEKGNISKNIENEKKFARINKIKIYKTIRKMEKTEKKKSRLLSEDLEGKSRKETVKLAGKIDEMTALYRKAVRKLRKRSGKLAVFSEEIGMDEQADFYIYEITLKTIMVLKNFENTYNCSILELLYKKQEIEIYKQKKKLKRLEKK